MNTEKGSICSCADFGEGTRIECSNKFNAILATREHLLRQSISTSTRCLAPTHPSETLWLCSPAPPAHYRAWGTCTGKDSHGGFYLELICYDWFVDHWHHLKVWCVMFGEFHEEKWKWNQVVMFQTAEHWHSLPQACQQTILASALKPGYLVQGRNYSAQIQSVLSGSRIVHTRLP